jgi:CrcB protein
MPLLPTLTVALGGALGASSRFWIGELLKNTPYPYSTWVVNLLGCFLLGFFYIYLEPFHSSWSSIKLFLFIGFLGAFTTFSTLALDSFLLLKETNLYHFLFYLFTHYFCCLFSVFIGVFLATKLTSH